MIVLGIESATIEVGVCLYGDEGLVASFRARVGRRHAETLHPALEGLLQASKLELGDLGGIAVDVGPGLFTGLRVGVAAAKALAFALSCPVVGLSSTEVLKSGVSLARQPVVPVIDMRRGQLAYELPGSPGPLLGTPEELALGIEAAGLFDVVLVGDGALRYEDQLKARLFGIVSGVAQSEHAAPNVVELAGLGHRALLGGEGVDPFELEPLYLRLPDAKENYATRAAPAAGS